MDRNSPNTLIGETESKRPVSSESIFRRTIGIVGGLGPYAHIELERLLLRHAARYLGHAPCDQEYPEWIVSSIPGTPDRTEAIRNGGQSPVPWIERSLKRLEGSPPSPGADFAMIACVTAHAYIDELKRLTRIPILNIVRETLVKSTRTPGISTIGLLATTGTLQARVFEKEAERAGLEFSSISLLDLPEGSALQEELVMNAIYGPPGKQGQRSGGIKSGLSEDSARNRQLTRPLRSAVRCLTEAGADMVLIACTEIPLAIGRGPVDGIPLLDPLDVAAEAAIQIAAGSRPLPSDTEST